MGTLIANAVLASTALRSSLLHWPDRPFHRNVRPDRAVCLYPKLVRCCGNTVGKCAGLFIETADMIRAVAVTVQVSAVGEPLTISGVIHPPLKWSTTFSCVFAHKEDRNVEEELQAGSVRAPPGSPSVRTARRFPGKQRKLQGACPSEPQREISRRATKSWPHLGMTARPPALSMARSAHVRRSAHVWIPQGRYGRSELTLLGSNRQREQPSRWMFEIATVMTTISRPCA